MRHGGLMSYKLASIPGDGTGPEVVREGLKVLEAAASRAGFGYTLEEYDFGAERYLRTGETLPDTAVEELREFDSIFLGAIGHPDVAPGVLEQGILLRVRFDLDLYINLRPVKLLPGVQTPISGKGPEDIDFVVVRENTEGLYASTGGFLRKGTLDEIVTDNMFGDIITDLAAMIQGGLGIAAGGNINPEGTAMFEPMGGSAPKYAGQNKINPLAAIGAVQMMLDHLGEREAAGWVEGALIRTIGDLDSLAAGRMGKTKEAVGDLVACYVGEVA